MSKVDWKIWHKGIRMKIFGKRLLYLGFILFFLRSGIVFALNIYYNEVKISQELKQAFQKYWMLRSKKSIKSLLKREAPYIQDMVSFERYKRYILLYKSTIKKIEVKKVDCPQPFFCAIEFKSLWGEGKKQQIYWFRDLWVKVEGKWYHVIKNPLFFPEIN